MFSHRFRIQWENINTPVRIHQTECMDYTNQPTNQPYNQNEINNSIMGLCAIVTRYDFIILSLAIHGFRSDGPSVGAMVKAHTLHHLAHDSHILRLVRNFVMLLLLLFHEVHESN